jgi:hypothetical protein
MFKQLVPLSAEDHRALRLTPNQPFDFAREQALIPLTRTEAAKVAREMVIVFPQQQGVPQALAGYDPSENLYVNERGHWIGRYIPAHLRRYPFILGEVPTSAEEQIQTGRRFGLQIDIEAPHLSETGTHPLFGNQGEPSDVLNKIQKVLMFLQQDFEKTQTLVDELDELKLLVDAPIKLNLPDGNSRELTGFRVVDQQALAQLSATQLADIRTSGALALVYAHIMSLTNLEDGWLAKKAEGQTADKNFDIEDYFYEGDDDNLTFDS